MDAVGRDAELRLAGVLCNDAQPGLGDPTETALLEASGLDVVQTRARHPRLDALPFDAARRPMATLHHDALYVKGAPGAVLPLCAGAEDAEAQIDGQTALGRRVLVFAARDGATALDLAPPLRLLGLQALADPPRPGVEEAVAACRAAGVRVMMLTGDHPRTARAIGTAIGLPDGPAVTGAQPRQHARRAPGRGAHLRPRRARAQAAARAGAAGARGGRRGDGGRRQRRTRAAPGRHRRGDGGGGTGPCSCGRWSSR